MKDVGFSNYISGDNIFVLKKKIVMTKVEKVDGWWQNGFDFVNGSGVLMRNRILLFLEG